MRVYHFTKAAHGLDAIRRRRLKIARISELNDPFEFLQVASTNPKTRGRYQYVKRALSEYMGLLCFSANWSNPVQWSHYAESHRGICLGFDVSSSADIRKVRYVKNRIPSNLRAMKVMGPDAVARMLDLLTVKFDHWSYEQEHRLFVRLDDREDETGLYFFDFGNSADNLAPSTGARPPALHRSCLYRSPDGHAEAPRPNRADQAPVRVRAKARSHP